MRVSFFVWILILLGCSSPPIEPILIAMNPWPGYEFLYLAQEKHFFEEEGAKVRILEFSSLGDCRVAFDRGHSDGMCCTAIEFLISKSSSERDPRMVLMADYSDGADFILAQPELKNISDLKGKKVAAEVGTLNMYMLARALSLNGLDLTDVHLVQHDQIGMAAVFKNREVDAVVTYVPVATSLIHDSSANQLFSSKDIPNEVIDLLCFDRMIIETRFDEVVGILNAWDRSLEYAKNHPAEAYAIMAKREGIGPDDFEQALAGVKVLTCEDQKEIIGESGHLETVFAMAQEVLLETHQIDRSIQIETCVDGSPLAEAISR